MTIANTFVILTALICQFINHSHQNNRNCPVPRLLNGGYRVEASFVILFCDEGYQLVGPKQIKCIRKTWNPPPTLAKCERETADLKENEVPVKQFCSALNIIENGNVQPERPNGFYEVGDMIVARCDYYYEAIPGETSLRCVKGPRWSGAFPTCQRTCEQLRNEKNGEWKLSKNQNTRELQAVFVCDQGHQLVRGTEGKTCIRSNTGYQWIGEDPYCRELEFLVEDNDRDKTCPQPPLILNGQVFPNKMGGKYFVGEQINVECNPTFHPVRGSAALHCTDEGKWSDDFPECKALTCLIVAHPDNGNILELTSNNQIFNYGDVIRYKCKRGYRLKGEHRRLCGADGWSSNDPICELVACGDLPALDYSRPKSFPPEKTFTPGEELEVECLFGFQKRNQQRPLHLFCNENGQWDTSYAECQPITCEKPRTIENGVYERLTESEKNFYYGDEIQYTCQNDLVLVGQATLTCSATGWSHDYPSCQELYCDQPDLSDGVRIERSTLPLNKKDKYPFRTEIFYECENVNYELSGSLSQTCEQNGWTGRTPFCRLSGCLEPKTPENGRISGRYKIRQYSKFYAVGDYVLFSCNYGYKIDRESTSHCAADGTWTSSPRCIEIYCELPDHPTNGKYLDILPEDGARYPVNYVITFKCDTGYKPSTSTYFNKRQCYSNGRWTNYQPKCEAVRCDRPPDVPNAVLLTTISEPPRTRSGGYSRLLDMKAGFETTYKCRDGLRMITRGEERPVLTCLETGVWSEPNFQCQSAQCGLLPRVNNGYLSTYYRQDYYQVGSRARVNCYEGFIPFKEEVTCQPDGLWDVEPDPCQSYYKAVGCGPVPQIQHGYLSTYPNDRLYDVGTVAQVFCEGGYVQNTHYVVCSEDGNWNVTGTECETKQIVCGRVPRIPNGIVVPPSGMKKYPIGTRANVICNEDFQTKQNFVICGDDGHWDLVDVSCNQLTKFCGPPPRVSKHGFIVDYESQKKLYPQGYSITYACDQNYTLVPLGYERNACTTSGWLHDAPQCVAEWCDPIPVIENGHLKPQKSAKMKPNLDKLEVVCNFGFASTKEFLQCDQEGRWSVNTIVCERDRSTDCDKPEPFENGYIENVSDLEEATYPLEHPITYKCRENYLLDGDETRFCSEGGWSGEAPVCKLNSCKIPKKLSNTETDIPVRVGEIYILRCPPGQMIADGNDVVECLEGGRWNCSLPRCQPFDKKICPNTEFSDERGRFVPTDQNTIRLVCQDDYIPLNINVSSSTCDERSGTWNIPHDMACVPLKPSKICSEPDSFDHGTISGLKEIPIYKEGDKLTVSCEKGYGLAAGGTDTVTCLASGYWDGVLSSCAPIQCEIDQNLENGEFEPALRGDNLPYNEVLNVKCKLGYQILQKGILRCSENGWDGPMPSCKKIKCSDPGIPENGWYHVTSFDYGQRVTFGCFSGYKLYGSKERVCLGNGKWSGALTVCDAGNQDCPEPGTPSNALKSGVHYNNGDVVKYSCLNGYTLMGSRSRTCKNRTWTGQEPECIGKLDYDDPNDVSQRLRFLLKQMNHVENTGSNLVEAPKPSSEIDRRVVNDPKRQNINSALLKKNMLVVCFIFDSSSSIGDHNFQKSIKLAQALIGNLNITKNETRSCVLVFNSDAKVEFTPSEFRSTAQIINDLNTIRYEGGKGKSLFTAFKTFEEGILNPTVANFPDKEISFLTFLFTDGKVKPDYKLHKLVGNLRRDFNLRVYCVALTGFPNKDVLFSITSSYRNVKRIFLLDSYSTMDKITKDLIAGDEIDYSVCGRGFDSSLVVEDLSTKNTSDTDHSTLQLWPWTVQLMKVENSKSYLPTCLGSLVNKKWVLTSALCFPKDVDPRRILTKTGIENYHLSLGERIVYFGKSKVDKNAWSANVALIKLKKPVTFSEFIHPVCLPDKRQNLFQSDGQRKSGYSISWAKGIETERRGNIAQMHMTVQNKDDCVKSLNHQLTDEKTLDTSMFCASDNTGSLEVCGPDLGSPLYQFNVNSENQAQWVQIGVASAFESQSESEETSCVKPSRFYDVFLDVSVVTPAIKNIIDA